MIQLYIVKYTAIDKIVDNSVCTLRLNLSVRLIFDLIFPTTYFISNSYRYTRNTLRQFWIMDCSCLIYIRHTAINCAVMLIDNEHLWILSFTLLMSFSSHTVMPIVWWKQLHWMTSRHHMWSQMKRDCLSR